MLKNLKIGILLFLVSIAVQAQINDFPFEKVTLHSGGKPDNESIVVAIFGDGYRAQDQEKFMGVARAYKDHILAAKPYNLFANQMNIYAIKVVSNAESFSSNTYFGTVQSNQTMNIPSAGKDKLADLLRHHTPAVNIPVVFINTTDYGGLAMQIGGFPNVSSSAGHQGNPHGLLMHEVGHSFANLNDEYTGTGGTSESRFNTSYLNDNQNTIKWRAFWGINDDGLGAIGANQLVNRTGQPSGNGWWYRPRGHDDCTMGGYDGMARPHCIVCQAQITKTAAGIVGEIFLGGDDKETLVNVNSNHNRILNFAFFGMYALQNVNIASTVTSIGDYAFLACTSLTTIVNFATNPQTLNDKTFGGIGSNKVNRSKITVYVPAASVAAYKTAWTGFKDILAITDQKEPIAGKPIKITRARVNSWQSKDDPYVRDALYDGNQSTFWHARWDNGTDGGSGHRGGESFADLDLGSVQTITEIQVDGRANGGNPQIIELRMLQHGETGNTFPNGESMGGNPYPTTAANVSQALITADFAMTGWTAVNAAPSGLGTRNAVLLLETPITARYIRLGITNAKTGNDPNFTQVAEIRVLKPGTAPIPTEPIITVTHSTGGKVMDGSTAINSGTGLTVTSGSNKTFTFVEDDGFTINDVKINGVSNSAALSSKSHTFNNVTGNARIDVTFIPTGGGDKDCDGVKTFAQQAAEGFMTQIAGFFTVVHNGKLWTNKGKVNSITSFDENDWNLEGICSGGAGIPSYNITVNYSDGGKATRYTMGPVTSGTNIAVDEGGSLHLEFRANEDYEILSVKIDGDFAELESNGDYKFTNVNANSIIEVTFRLIDSGTSIKKNEKSDSRYGIKFARNIVSDRAEIGVIFPNNERATETKIAIYDMTGNVVYSTASTGSATVSWNLTNTAGRFLANGTYLVIAEVKAANGKVYMYSAKLGVKK